MKTRIKIVKFTKGFFNTFKADERNTASHHFAGIQFDLDGVPVKLVPYSQIKEVIYEQRD